MKRSNELFSLALYGSLIVTYCSAHETRKKNNENNHHVNGHYLDDYSHRIHQDIHHKIRNLHHGKERHHHHHNYDKHHQDVLKHLEQERMRRNHNGRFSHKEEERIIKDYLRQQKNKNDIHTEHNKRHYDNNKHFDNKMHNKHFDNKMHNEQFDNKMHNKHFHNEMHNKHFDNKAHVEMYKRDFNAKMSRSQTNQHRSILMNHQRNSGHSYFTHQNYQNRADISSSNETSMPMCLSRKRPMFVDFLAGPASGGVSVESSGNIPVLTSSTIITGPTGAPITADACVESSPTPQ